MDLFVNVDVDDLAKATEIAGHGDAQPRPVP